MATQEHITKHRILELLDYVKDQETPVINVLGLGVVRGVEAYPHRSFDTP